MNRIELTNFRVFQKTTSFDLAPITILTGKNNSGKSSLIKSFILLSDYMEPDNNQLILDLNGKQAHKHKINKFDNLVNWNENSKDVTYSYRMDEFIFTLTFSGHPDDTFATLSKFTAIIETNQEELVLERRNLFYFELIVSQIFVDYIVNYQDDTESLSEPYKGNYQKFSDNRVQINHVNKELESVILRKDQSKDNPVELSLLINRQQELENRLRILESNIRDASKNKKLKKKGVVYHTEIYAFEENLVRISLAGIVRRALSKYMEENKQYKFRNDSTESRALYRFYEKFQSIMSFSAYHLSPNRTYQSRLYFKHHTDSEINEIANQYAQAMPRKGGAGNRFMNRWLNEFELGEQVDVESIEGVASKITVLRRGRHINLTDLGFGAGQLLTILLKIATVVENNISRRNNQNFTNRLNLILIEEPESNLHPKLQSKLAEMFFEASKEFSLNFIIETHSEYLIRKCQSLVREIGIRHPFKVYYFNDQDAPYEMRFRKDGKFIDEFGAGFFDEARKLAFEIL